MAKGKRNKRKGKGGGPVIRPPTEHEIAAQVTPLVDAIAQSDEAASGPLWGQAHRLLLKSRMDHEALAAIIARRDVEALSRAVDALSRDAADEASAALEATAAPDDDAPIEDVETETLKKAMRAFRKRLKLTRLDHESKLGVGPMTGGRDSGIRAIMPPRAFDQTVWDALVREGKLRKAGPGFYELADE